IQITVTVDVRVCRAPADDRLMQGFARLAGGDRNERRPGRGGWVVPKQLRRLPETLPAGKSLDLRLDVPVDRQQVEPAVEVVIEKEYAERQREPGGIADAAQHGFI